MTAATPIPTAAESPPMDQTTEADPADPRPGSPPEALLSGHAPLPAAAARPTLRAQVAENPLASFLGAVIVALLVSMLATSNIGIDRLGDRIDHLGDRIDRQGDRIDRLEDKVDAGFAAQDAKFDDRFDELDAKFDEMNLKLTALIAKLNATDDVDAAVEGRLTDRAGDLSAGPGAS